MKYFVRGILALITVAVLAVLVVVTWFALTFDPNDYKAQIDTVLEDSLGREVSITGELSLKLLPCCGISVGETVISNPPGYPDEPFARINALSLGVALRPLLASSELEITNVALDGLRLNLTQLANGDANWEFPMAAEPVEDDAGVEVEANVELEGVSVGRITISDSEVRYRDAVAGDDITLRLDQLSTDNVTVGEPFTLEAAFSASGIAEGIEVAGSLDATTLVSESLDSALLSDSAFGLTLTGEELPGGSASATLTVGEIGARTGEAVTLDALVLTLNTASVELEAAASGRLVDSGPELSGTLQLREFSPRDLLRDSFDTRVITADPTVLAALAADGEWTLANNRAVVSVTRARLDDTDWTGQITVPDLDADALELNLEVGNLNADRYLPPEEGEGEAAGTAASDEGVEETDILPVDLLRELNLDATFRMQKLTYLGAELDNIDFEVTAKDGRIAVQPLNAELYGGLFDSTMRLNVNSDVPEVVIKPALNGVDLAQLGAGRRGLGTLSGTVAGNLDLKASGNRSSALINTLTGTTSLNVDNAVLEGVDLWYEIADSYARAKDKERPVPPADPRTDLGLLVSEGVMTNGVWKSTRLKAESPFWEITGGGSVDIPGDKLRLNIDAEIVKLPENVDDKLDVLVGLEVPIKVRGTLDKPEYSVDIGKLLAGLTTNTLKSKLRDLLGGDDDSDSEEAGEDDEPENELKRSILNLLGD